MGTLSSSIGRYLPSYSFGIYFFPSQKFPSLWLQLQSFASFIAVSILKIRVLHSFLTLLLSFSCNFNVGCVCLIDDSFTPCLVTTSPCSNPFMYLCTLPYPTRLFWFSSSMITISPVLTPICRVPARQYNILNDNLFTICPMSSKDTLGKLWHDSYK